MLKNAIIFITGIVIGGVSGYYIANRNKEAYIQEEVEGLREYYKEKYKENEEENEDTEDISKDDIPEDNTKFVEYEKIATSYTQPVKPDLKTLADRPYIISPDEVGEFEDYEVISLTLYSDKILADDMDEIVDDVDITVGVDNLREIGKYEKDVLHVRNDARKCDYEILSVLDKYNDLE